MNIENTQSHECAKGLTGVLHSFHYSAGEKLISRNSETVTNNHSYPYSQTQLEQCRPLEYPTHGSQQKHQKIPGFLIQVPQVFITGLPKHHQGRPQKLRLWTFRTHKVKCERAYWSFAFFPSSVKGRFIPVTWWIG